MLHLNLQTKFAQISDYWNPRIAGEVNGQQIKMVKILGEFIWHKHDNEDELFIVVDGLLTMEFRDRTVEVKPGEFLIVPKGVEHKPRARVPTSMVLIEPSSTLNTGNVKNERTRTHLERI
jgi:mannose-6-phosphate isomerase-like protein (cupin superfamily)